MEKGFRSRIQDPRRLRAMDTRDRAESGIRRFFLSRGFRETRTPVLVPCPGMEPHIRPFEVSPLGEGARAGFLQTSPEFAMKKLLVGGLERIFQLAPVFRSEPDARTHRPEFTMLEWYRARAGYEDVMRDAEELVAALATEIHGAPKIPRKTGAIDVSTPWPRLEIRDLFREHAGVDLAKADTAGLEAHCRRLGIQAPRGSAWDDLYFLIWLNAVEPKLPEGRAVFVMGYPASQAALSVVETTSDGWMRARRFEIYAGGLELANAFEELTDPVEQRARFEADMELRARAHGAGFPPSPVDEEFLAALEEGMPPSAGIALGVDRLAMLLADEGDIDYVRWL